MSRKTLDSHALDAKSIIDAAFVARSHGHGTAPVKVLDLQYAEALQNAAEMLMCGVRRHIVEEKMKEEEDGR